MVNRMLLAARPMLALLALLVSLGQAGSLRAQETPTATWENISPALVRGEGVDLVLPSTGGTLYALTRSALNRSDDAGQTWTQLSLPPATAGNRVIAVSPTDARVVFVDGQAGLYRSGDSGGNWTLVLPATGPTDRFAISRVSPSPADPSLVYAVVEGSFTEIFRSLDGGLSFQQVKDRPAVGDLPAAAPFGWLGSSLQPDSSSPERLFRVEKATLHHVQLALSQSLDRGDTWSRLFVFPHGQQTRLLGGYAAAPRRFYLVVDGTGQTQATSSWDAFRPVFRSDDDGATWTTVELPMARDLGKFDGSVTPWRRVVAVDPLDPDRLYAGATVSVGAFHVPPYYSPRPFQRMLTSTDGGDTWAPLSNVVEGSIADVKVDPEGRYLYAATHQLWRLALR